MEYYSLYVKLGCPYCKQAADLLEKKELQFELIVLDNSPVARKLYAERYEWETVPIIILNNEGEQKLIGGFSDLEKFLNNESENE